MAKISRDLSAGNLHPRETLVSVGTLGAANAEVVLNCDGCSSFAFDIRGTFSLSAQAQGTVDGTNWFPIMLRSLASPSFFIVAAGSAQQTLYGKAAPFKSIRIFCTAYTSGAASITLIGTTSIADESQSGTVTSSVTTAVGTAAAAVTLTLTSPGLGLRHYITFIEVERINGTAAALTAAAGPVNVTTTNIPGAMVIPFAADALGAGGLDRVRKEYNYPLAASGQNSTTTIVCPATTGVIWRATIGFYLAP